MGVPLKLSPASLPFGSVTATDKRIGYVIVSWRSAPFARRCMCSILAQRPAAEVMLVDAENFGYAQALNCGIRMLSDRSDVICCLNADTLALESDESVLELFDGVEQIGVIGPRQIDADDRIVHGGIVAYEDGSDWSVDLRHRCWRWELETDNETDALTRGTFDVPMVAGSVVYVRRAVLDALGGWCERLPFYYEDNLLAFRARWLGWKVVYHGGLTWRHYHEGSPVDQEWRNARMRESRQIFIEECGRLSIPLQQPPESGYRV